MLVVTYQRQYQGSSTGCSRWWSSIFITGFILDLIILLVLLSASLIVAQATLVNECTVSRHLTPEPGSLSKFTIQILLDFCRLPSIRFHRHSASVFIDYWKPVKRCSRLEFGMMLALTLSSSANKHLAHLACKVPQLWLGDYNPKCSLLSKIPSLA